MFPVTEVNRLALYFEGKSTCSICGDVVATADEVELFPVFIMNRQDPTSTFNDAVVHKECFARHPYAHRATKMYRDLVEHLNPDNRRCDICGMTISNPDDYMNFTCLSSDETDPLYRYNFTQYHPACFKSSEVAELIRGIISERVRQGVWEGCVLA